MELKKSMSQKLRMDGRDYSQPGWYFVTLGADYHKHLFGAVVNGVMKPNELGQLVEQCWREIPRHYGHIALGASQVMPNHFHGLVQITRPGVKGLGEVMNVFKGAVTREWRRHPAVSRYRESNPRVWAPNYYDVICFDAAELATKEAYILANPKRWVLRDVPKGIIKKTIYRGNKALLQAPRYRRALRVSRRTPAAAVTVLQAELAAFDGIVCSTFFSPGERACLQTLQTGKAGIIWVMPMAMPSRIATSWTDAFLEGRALWLSAFPDTDQEASRTSCEQANRWVARLCATTPSEQRPDTALFPAIAGARSGRTPAANRCHHGA